MIFAGACILSIKEAFPFLGPGIAVAAANSFRKGIPLCIRSYSVRRSYYVISKKYKCPPAVALVC